MICVCRISESLLNILAGEVLLDSGNANTELLKVRTVIIHNSYNSQTKLNDIALIEVTGTINSKVQNALIYQ